MSEPVADAYDDVAGLYASLFLRDLRDDVDAQPWLERFVELEDPARGPVVDAGCGPGHGVDYLTSVGLDAFGVDLSTGLLAKARAAFRRDVAAVAKRQHPLHAPVDRHGRGPLRSHLDSATGHAGP